jgi:hypothetical protein
MSLRRWALFFALVALGCSAAPKPITAPPPPPVTASAITAVVAPPTPEAPPLDRYQEELIRRFIRTNPARRGQQLDVSAEPPARVQVLDRIGRDRSVVVLTVGFGRVVRPEETLSPENKHVELYAEAEAFGPGIGEVLGALGKALHDAKGGGRAWHVYDAVQLPAPVAGLQFFDLRPGGELQVAPNLWVTLYKVVPLSEEEHDATLTRRGDQWMGEDETDPGGASRALKRWAPAAH